jgi:hypothetical protein
MSHKALLSLIVGLGLVLFFAALWSQRDPVTTASASTPSPSTSNGEGGAATKLSAVASRSSEVSFVGDVAESTADSAGAPAATPDALEPANTQEDWEAARARLIEERKQVALSPESSLAEKGKALKFLSAALADKDVPWRTAILDEAVWILNNTIDHDVLDDVFDGISKVRYEPLVDPIVRCLVNHRDERVRGYAAEVLHQYEGVERAVEALEHAALHDESARVRRRAARSE